MRVFISSTQQDLAAHRDRVAEAIERLGQERTRMEVFGARPETASVASLGELESSDAFVGIYAHRYGHVPRGSAKSITELEFDHAIQRGLPTFCFLVEEGFPWNPKEIEMEPGRSKLRAFKERISSTVVRDTFTTPDDLGFKVGATLGRFMIQHTVKAALSAASEAHQPISERAQNQVARRAERLGSILRGAGVLLVNDEPDGMQHVIRMLRELGLEVVIATSTSMGLEMLEVDRFDAVISDMWRGRDPEAGITLINAMRELGMHHPTILTVGRYEPELGTPPYAFGITNLVDELLNLLFDALERTRG